MKKNWLLFKIYFLAGAFTFSGGMAMLPVIEKELCQKRGLIDKETIREYATLSQTFPGVIALNNACFVGKRVNGIGGMVFAGIGAILPAYVLMTLATLLYQYLPKEGPVLSALTGIRATSASFLFAAAYTIARHNLKSKYAVGLALFAFLATVLNLISAPVLIVIAVVLGGVIATFRKEGQK